MADEHIANGRMRTLEENPVTLYSRHTQSGAGAVSAYTYRRGIGTISWPSTGVMKVALRRPWGKLLMARATVLADTPAWNHFELDAEDVDGASPYVQFNVSDLATPSAETPLSCDILVEIVVQDGKDY